MLLLKEKNFSTLKRKKCKYFKQGNERDSGLMNEERQFKKMRTTAPVGMNRGLRRMTILILTRL